MSTREAASLKSAMYREALGFMWNNAPVLFRQVREYVDKRVRGEPFSAEQVAKWIQESEPLMEDWKERHDRLVEAIRPLVDEQHRELLERDLERFDRRMERFEALRESWSKGNWKPEQWGLDDDPIQNQGLGEGLSGFTPIERAAMLRRGRLPAKHWDYDPSTWERYVRAFIALYDLDAGQIDAAESILAELLARAADYMWSHRVALADIPRDQRSTHERFRPLRDMFAELKTRLARIPRDAQRRAVEAQSRSRPKPARPHRSG
jgi:hypothetical protein